MSVKRTYDTGDKKNINFKVYETFVTTGFEVNFNWDSENIR